MTSVNKVIRDGKVAVLYSPGWGASWSSDYTGECKNFLMFDPELVNLVEEDKRSQIPAYIATTKFAEEVYCGGADDLIIEWIPVGTEFRISEYDGYESIVYNNKNYWTVA